MAPAAPSQPVRRKVWLGLILALQALACWPLASLFGLQARYGSHCLGVVGLLILIASKAMPAAYLPEAAASAALYPDAASHQPADAAD